MAELAIKKLDEQLNCPICLDTFVDPKILQCFHIFCRQCLVPLVVRDGKGELGLPCPNCRKVTPIPDRGVAGLQAAFRINRLLEIQESLQGSSPPASPIPTTPSKVKYCTEHIGEELKLYCETCGELICYKCALKYGKHHDHDYEEITRAFDKYTKEITSLMDPIGKKIDIMEASLSLLETYCKDISKQQLVIEEDIHCTFVHIQEVLACRENELISQLDQMTQEKLSALAAQKEQILTILAQQRSCLTLARDALKKENRQEALVTRERMVEKIRGGYATLDGDLLKPTAQADMRFSALNNIDEECGNYGLVLSTNVPDPSKCHVTNTSFAEALVGTKCLAILHTLNPEGNPCEELVKCVVEGELVSELTGNTISCNVERAGGGQFEISYQPAIKGKHKLHIKVEGQCIRGCPFGVVVKSPLKNLCNPILTIDDVVGSWGVAVNQKEELVVTKYNAHCVSVFSPNGQKLRSFGMHGSSPGQFEGPCGVAVDNEGNIFVTDTGNSRIQKFTSNGEFLATAGMNGKGQLQFLFNMDVAFNSSNKKVYVLDRGNCRIQVLNSDLTFSNSFGKKGHSKGQFSSPCGVACDSTGKVYVADSQNHRIQVFTADGKHLMMFGRHGQREGELDWPCHVAVDISGMVYVSEGGIHRVSVFTSQGEFVTSFGRKGKGPGKFDSTRGLAVDESGLVYVCDYNDRVQIF